MDFASVALVAVPIALSALAFVAYNHPSQYQFLQLALVGLIVLAITAAGGYAFGSLHMQQDMLSALRPLTHDCQSAARGAIDTVQLPAFNTINLSLFACLLVVAFLGYLPRLGITKDHR